MPKLRMYRVFISHAWTYNESYYRLVNMLNKEPYLNCPNYSVPQHAPLAARTDRELENALRNQISPTHIVIVLSGMYVAHRKWIQKEIDIASNMGKPIIGVRLRGHERLPQVVQDVAKEIVGWNTPSIVSAIRKHAL